MKMMIYWLFSSLQVCFQLLLLIQMMDDGGKIAEVDFLDVASVDADVQLLAAGGLDGEKRIDHIGYAEVGGVFLGLGQVGIAEDGDVDTFVTISRFAQSVPEGLQEVEILLFGQLDVLALCVPTGEGDQTEQV